LGDNRQPVGEAVRRTKLEGLGELKIHLGIISAPRYPGIAEHKDGARRLVPYA
jgi:hypothetical protein